MEQVKGDRRVYKTAFVIPLLLSLCVAGFVWLAGYIEGNSFDDAGIVWVYQSKFKIFDILMPLASYIGDIFGSTIQISFVVAGITLKRPKYWHLYIIFILFSVALGYMVNVEVKELYMRPRPDLYVNEHVLREKDTSFPSGHAWAATCFYGAIAYLIIKHVKSLWKKVLSGGLAALMIVGISYSRVYLGVHYPVDVIAGILGGGAWLVISVVLLNIVISRISVRERISYARGYD